MTLIRVTNVYPKVTADTDRVFCLWQVSCELCVCPEGRPAGRFRGGAAARARKKDNTSDVEVGKQKNVRIRPVVELAVPRR